LARFFVKIVTNVILQVSDKNWTSHYE